MTQKFEMADRFNPSAVEQALYQHWEESGYFKPSENENAPSYCIAIPPPNVTGSLHMGHAFQQTLMDTLIRFNRMEGHNTLWQAGTDHAGIATQMVVERKIAAEEGKTRHDYGREAFINKIWDWKAYSGGTISQQMRRLGNSIDWERERFTMDDGLSNAVKEVFVRLHEEGLIYRGKRLVNWDPKLHTAISDLEVENKESKGSLWHFRYPLANGAKTADGKDYLVVATTRPETMLGDTAVAVHPEDERYQSLIGKTVVLPLANREIPIIADEYVDREFGTGVVKITPAHDFNDYEVGKRHSLPMVNVLTLNADIRDEAEIIGTDGKPLAGYEATIPADYRGLERFAARKKIVADFEALGLLDEIKPHDLKVPYGDRGGVPIEPMLTDQWYVSVKPLADVAIKAVEDGEIQFVPKQYENLYFSWMRDIQDWCISRQLWWGHRIPAWYHKETGEVYVDVNPPKDIENYVQDEDVLDTWYSSALFPFSTLGWPDLESEDFKRYYPNSCLVTGYDIIFFWVARMVFQGLEFTGTRPFEDCLIHGLVRDEQGRKMSKSLGNGVDPMEVIEQYGADSLRYFLATNSTPGQDLRYSTEKIEASWNYINKIWNASRFVIMNLEGFEYSDIDLTGEKTLADKYILTKLAKTIEDFERLFEKYEFGEASRILYNFVWEEFCSWYIEIAKISLNGEDEAAKKTTKSILVYVLDASLKMLHPFMPFVTEEIWQHIPHTGDSIVTSEFAKVDSSLVFEKETEDMQFIQDVITAVRNIRSEVNAPMSREIPIKIKYSQDSVKEVLLSGSAYLEKFARPSELIIEREVEASETDISRILPGAEIYVSLSDLIDVDKEKERLGKELEKLQQELDRVNKKLSNEKFVGSAPEAVVAKEKEKQATYQEQYDSVKERIAALDNLK